MELKRAHPYLERTATSLRKMVPKNGKRGLKFQGIKEERQRELQNGKANQCNLQIDLLDRAFNKA